MRRLNYKDFAKKTFLFFITFFIVFQGIARSDSFSSLNNKGNKHYNKGLYDKALKYYQEAEIKNPTSPELSYNLGNVFYQKQDYKEALLKYYQATDLKDSLAQANTYYNLGNTFYRTGKYQEAIGAYQKCLEINPGDEDAKYNLELVKKKMEKMLENEKKRQEEQKEDKKEEEQKPKEEKGQQKEPSESEKEKQKEKESLGKDREKERKEEKKKKPPPPKEGMTKEDAQRILNSIKDDEKELQKQKKRFLSKKIIKVGKDW